MHEYKDPYDLSILADPAQVVEKLKEFGVIGLLVLNKGGLSLLVRDYDSRGIFNIENASLVTSFVAAVISYANSIKGSLTDIGLGGTRLVVKPHHDIIFCLFLDEKYLRRNLGEVFFDFVDLSLTNLTKVFQSFIQLTGKQIIVNSDLLKQFQGQADIILFESLVKSAQYYSVKLSPDVSN